MRPTAWLLALVLALTTSTRPARAQDADSEGKAAIDVADSVLKALSTGDRATLSRLTLDSSVVGGGGRLSTWRVFTSGTGPSTFTERGFDATARVQDKVAQVWVLYDLYRGDTWSHCGVDVFTMMKREGHWRVAALIYTIEQPPACGKHPAGPPVSLK